MSPITPVDPHETLDRLAGEWWIYQLRRGHRYNTDDVLTAWTACKTLPGATRVLDLGAGSGSIGLLSLLCLKPSARLTTLELQAVNIGLLRRTVAHNGLEARVEIRQGDVRDPGCIGPDDRFDLITANPPYFRLEAASPSPNLHRATARHELNGDVFDFCRTASRHLMEEGCFVLCHAAGDPRPEQAIVQAGLTLRARRSVVFREGDKPVIAIFTCGFGGARHDLPPLAIRDRDGVRTDAYRAVRVAMWIDA